jgi:hypothetical protein
MPQSLREQVGRAVLCAPKKRGGCPAGSGGGPALPSVTDPLPHSLLSDAARREPSCQRLSCAQGCIKLALVRAGAGVQEVSPFLSDDQSNPAGLAAGSRWSFLGRRGNDHRIREPKVLASRRDARTARAQVIPAHCQARPNTGRQGLWHPFWVRGRVCVYPVVGPLHPSRPPATGCQPCRVGFGKRARNQSLPHGSQELDAALSFARFVLPGLF